MGSPTRELALKKIGRTAVRQAAIDRVKASGIFPAPVITPTTETTVEIIADSIAAIGEAVRDLKAGRLNHRAVVLLIHDSSGVPKREIQKVLDSIASLEATYLKARGT